MSEQQAVEGESGRASLARTLRFLREKAGISLGKLAEDTAYDKSYLSRLESGERLSKLAVMEDLDRYYGSGDLLVTHWKGARREAFKDQYKEYMRLEATARVMWMFQLAVPGLLQTEDFAREVLSADQTTSLNSEKVEEDVAARIGRQELLYRDPPPSIRIILDEGALRRVAREPLVWENQLSRLVEAAEQPSIALQVLPLAAGLHSLMGSHVSLLWQRTGDPVAYVEGNGVGELIEEPDRVLGYRLSYDRVRDMALPPLESAAFIRGVLKEHRS
ncbi:helix-turn-helix domain-containing protein [Streptomyces sp. G45]|uniref:helix-turn-helix domain-containing protein n=1 Tax=Streptomyces sp. G45 TaxID=3406627 RepID=UPI003C17E5C5